MTSHHGRVIAVTERALGSALASAHAAGVTTLTLLDTLDFPEPPTDENLQARIVSEDRTVTEVIDYRAVDDDAATLTLAFSTSTALAHAEEAAVEVWPRAVERVAQVHLDDSEEEADVVTIRVPHTLRDKLVEGVRDAYERESVELVEQGDQLVLADAYAEEQRLEGPVVVSSAKYHRTSSIGIATGTDVRLKFNNRRWDDLAAGNIESNSNDTFTVRRAGLYRITARVMWDGSTGSAKRVVSIVHNTGGTDALATEDILLVGGGGVHSQQCSCVVEASEGDYFFIRVFQNSGATLNVLGEIAGSSTQMVMEYLGVRPRP